MALYTKHSRNDKAASMGKSFVSRIGAGMVLGGMIVAVVAAVILQRPPRDGAEKTGKDVSPKRRIDNAANAISARDAEASEGETVAEAELRLDVKRDHSELSREDLIGKVPHWAYTVEDRKRVDPGYAKKHERFLQRKERNPWRTYADNSLALLLFGNGNIGFMPAFTPSFKDAFLKSIQTPIVVSQNDPPELQEQKRLLIETKLWLKEQMDNGEDIVAILNEEYARQKKIAGLRDTLKRELFQIQKAAESVQEVEDFVEAANIMLQEAGDTRGLKFPTIMTKLRIQREAERTGGE